ALRTIPVQLTPDIRKPVITIQTSWPSAAPAEVEREILIRQEDVLKGLEGLEKISGTASQGRSEITLEFAIGQNMREALLLVANRLDRVSNYPQEVDNPILQTAGTEDNPIAWFNIRPLEASQAQPIHQYGDLVEEFVRERLDRINGVGGVNVFGGSEQELQVIVDPARLARHGVTVRQLLQAMRNANVSMSAGDVDEGKRRYVVRSEAELNSPELVAGVVVRESGPLGRVTVGDLAQVQFGYKEPTARIRLNGEPALALNVVRDAGANVIEVMERIQATVAELNQGLLAQNGLIMRQTYDETVYIAAAVDLVQQNIVVGGGLAILILMIFLRSWRATLVVALAIPVSVIGAFV
ncbi:MAG TPA: efflux RND transporter permease subunit, partial [Candidatus Paceibacterota bacterium]|nr:efflux RND transporter permease subunit [Candidatus Paceibacterota bacterium]